MSMKNVGDLMKRLQKMMPAHVEPAFKTGEELLAWQKEQGKLRSEALERENRAMKMQRTFNRSGIRPLHQNCSLDNYRVECEGQMIALSRARQYVEEFDGNIASFIFSGKPGTGKNHLAAANRCQTRDKIEKSGLSGSVRASDADGFVGGNLEVDTVDRRQRTIVL